MSVHDAAKSYRKQLVELIEASGYKRRACRQAGIHHSTFYRWRRRLEDPTRPIPRQGSWVEQHLEAEIVATALANPAAGPQRVSDLLTQRDQPVSPTKVWRTLKRHHLNTRGLRYQLLRQHQTPAPEPVVVSTPRTRFVGKLDADLPGDLVQMDCFHVGSFKETRLGQAKATKGTIWQYTAIDVASSWLWAELHVTPHNPSPAITSQLAHRVAEDLNEWGWPLQRVSTDNGNEYRSRLFTTTMNQLDAKHRFIRAGRPQSNGKVERVQGTILEEFYQPALINYVEPSITGLRRDLDAYINYYNHQRPHRGKWNNRQPPAAIIKPDTKLIP